MIKTFRQKRLVKVEVCLEKKPPRAQTFHNFQESCPNNKLKKLNLNPFRNVFGSCGKFKSYKPFVKLKIKHVFAPITENEKLFVFGCVLDVFFIVFRCFLFPKQN